MPVRTDATVDLPEIILIGLPADKARIRPVAEALLARGVGFWLEEAPPQSGKAVKAIDGARCVVFVWTRQSAADADFLKLAARALAAGSAIGVRLDDVMPPAALGKMTTIKLKGFKGTPIDRVWHTLFLSDLARAAQAKAANIDPPPARGPLGEFAKYVAMIVPFAVLLLGIGANVEQFKSYFRAPASAERRMVSALPPGDCAALRAYVSKYPDGYYADKARALSSNSNPAGKSQWVTDSGELDIYVGDGDVKPAATVREAQARSDAAARDKAKDRCQPYVRSAGARNLSVSYEEASRRVSCERFAAGVTCSVQVKAVCTYEREQLQETCGVLKP